MNKKVLELQKWLNSKGANLVEDGIGGKNTRNAILTLFVNRNANKITPADITLIAESLGTSSYQVMAVAEVEANGAAWDRQGRLKVLWERHYMWKRIQKRVPLLSDPKPGGYTLDADKDGINDSWEKIADAACRWGIIAFECASFGKFQIMGAWWKDLGYASPIDFAWELSRDEYSNYDALARFVRRNNLIPAMKKLSSRSEHNRAFARGYNGPAYAKNRYHEKLAAAMGRLNPYG